MSVTSISQHQDDEPDPAQDIPAEQAVLGALMLSKNAITDVGETLGAEHFYRPAHSTIYQCVMDMYLQGDPADAITVSAELARRGELQRAGGGPYLHTLIAYVPTATNASHYAQQVLDAAARRLTSEVGAALTAYATTPSADAAEVLDRARERINDAVDHRANAGSSGVQWIDLLQPTMDQLDGIASGGNQGVPSGFTDLDEVTNGFHPGQMIIVAARPGAGKSAVGTDICRAAAMRNGIGTLLFSLEMGRSELAMRMLSAEAGIRLNDMRSGRMTEADWDRMSTRMHEVSEAPLVIDDTANLTPVDLSARARQWKRRQEIGLIVVDYMQLMNPSKRAESRQQEVSECSRSLKLLAKELEVPVVAISQLNRGPEQRTDKKPQLSDLRESGSLEQDADMVVLLHRPDAYERDDPRMGEADFILAKHRAGPTTTVTVAQQLHYSRFVDMAKE